MLTVGDRLPSFSLQAVVGLEQGREFQPITHESYPGRWKVLFFWPMDFTFVCPTEIAAFGRRNGDFLDRDTQLLGASIDTEYVHLAWRKDHKDLKELPFPMLADTKRELSQALGVLHQEAGVALRATFIVDPEGVIRHVSVNDLSVGRSVDEVLRVLDALQSGELCPCNWKKGEATLKP
jgi:peroxiredoxin (alkyl hydroperoxide reductase subunit C)